MPARTKAPKKAEPAPPAAPEPAEDLAARIAALETERDQLRNQLASATWERDVLREDNLRLRGEKAELQDRVKLFQLTTGVSAVGNIVQALFGRR